MKQTAMQELKWFVYDGLDNFDESVKVSKIWAKIIELLEIEKQQQGYSEEDMKEAYFSAIESMGEGWNGEYAEGNNPNIEEKFKEGFNEWFNKFKNK